MYDLIQVLYQYAQEQQMPAALAAEDPDSRRARSLAEGEQAELEGVLEGGAARLLSRYLDHQAQADLAHDRALFRCGLAMGLALERL